jgi:hypothetical protein
MVHKIVRLGWVSLLVLMLLSIASAFSASLTMSASHAGYMKRSITANDLKPPECASLNLTSIIIESANHVHTNPALIIGSPQNDSINTSASFADCVLGGGGNDNLSGNQGLKNAVLVGGPGSDQLSYGAVCYGGPGNDTGDVDTFTNCTITR